MNHQQPLDWSRAFPQLHEAQKNQLQLDCWSGLQRCTHGYVQVKVYLKSILSGYKTLKMIIVNGAYVHFTLDRDPQAHFHVQDMWHLKALLNKT